MFNFEMFSVTSIIVDLLLWIIMMFVIYRAFERMKFFGGYIVCYIFQLINTIIEGEFGVLTLFIILISALIEAAIYNWIYEKSDSFGKFIRRYIIFTIIVVVIFIIIFVVSGISIYSEFMEIFDQVSHMV